MSLGAAHSQDEVPVVLVTGAGSGLGAATCRALIRSGRRPLVTDIDGAAARNVARELETDWAVLDVARPESWADLHDQLTRAGTEVEALLLNAGLAGGGSIETFDLRRYHALFAVNVHGVVHGIGTFGPDLRRRGQGSIVVTASMAGLTGVPFDPFYAMTKHAVIGLVRSIAAEYLADCVRVQAVCPGLVDTPLLGKARQQIEEVGYVLLDPVVVAAVLADCVLGERTDLVTVVQAGRAPTAYRFAGVPGPASGNTALPVQLELGRE